MTKCINQNFAKKHGYAYLYYSISECGNNSGENALEWQVENSPIVVFFSWRGIPPFPPRTRLPPPPPRIFSRQRLKFSQVIDVHKNCLWCYWPCSQTKMSPTNFLGSSKQMFMPYGIRVYGKHRVKNSIHYIRCASSEISCI